MVGWHHQLDGHEFEQALGDGEGQGSLVLLQSTGVTESDMTEQMNKNSIACNYPTLSNAVSVSHTRSPSKSEVRPQQTLAGVYLTATPGCWRSTSALPGAVHSFL